MLIATIETLFIQSGDYLYMDFAVVAPHQYVADTQRMSGCLHHINEEVRKRT